MISACVGDIKINYGKWYTIVGKTAYEYTICEFCVRNGCVEKSDVYELDEVNQYSCNCRNSHAYIEQYVCMDCIADCNFTILNINKCIIGPTTNTVGTGSSPVLFPRCTTCKEFINKYTTYCQGCSAIFGKCTYCGVNKNFNGERISDKKIEK